MISKWFFFLAIVILLGAVALGFNVKDAKWLNKNIANAEAERIQVEAAHQRATYEIQERLAAAQADAEIRQIQREQQLLDAQYAHDIQALNQDLAHRDVAFRAWMTVLTLLAGAVSLTLFFGVIIWIGAKAWVYVQSISPKEVPMAKKVPPVEQRIPNLSERELYDLWADPYYRRQMRTAAQERERQAREEQQQAELIEMRMRHVADPAKMSRDQYNSLPLTGD